MTPASVGGAHNPMVKPFSSISIGIIIMQPQHPSNEAKCETTILQHRRMSTASSSPAAWVCSDRLLEHGAVAEAEQHLQRYAIDVQPVRVKNRTRGAPRRCSAAREVGVGLEDTRADVYMSCRTATNMFASRGPRTAYALGRYAVLVPRGDHGRRHVHRALQQRQ